MLFSTEVTHEPSAALPVQVCTVCIIAKAKARLAAFRFRPARRVPPRGADQGQCRGVARCCRRRRSAGVGAGRDDFEGGGGWTTGICIAVDGTEGQRWVPVDGTGT